MKTFLLILGGIPLMATALAAQPREAAVQERCEPTATIPVAGGAYMVMNGEWNSSAKSCVSTDRSASFTLTASEIDNRKQGIPGGFPAIYQGCHWGACTTVNPFPIEVGKLQRETATWNVTTAEGNWDQMFDLWFATRPSVPGQPDGAEVMVLVRPAPGQGFPGKKVANVKLGGDRFDIWFASPPQTACNYIAYVPAKPLTKTSFDLRPFIRDAVKRGYVDPKWYQISLEAGFEIWHRGAGLKTNSFAVSVK